MRVIAGDARSVPLVAPKGSTTRPTSDLLKGAMFSMLGERGGRGCVLDLFAGSGALGIEALSRGAEWCDFVEQSPAACSAIRANLEKTRLVERAGVHCLPVQRWLAQAAGVAGRKVDAHANYDLVLVDPPYLLAGQDALLRALGESGLLRAGATVVLEHSRRFLPPPVPGPLALQRTRVHGDSAFSLYEAP